jgi:hypothetical protein
MASPQHRISACAAAITAAATGLLWTDAASASQGPGVGPGTASDFTQLVMAVILWGTAALVVGIGLIGAVWRR